MTRPMQSVVRHLRRVVLARDGAGLSDGQLLTLFIERRDNAAFEALVRRHGSMVTGVCRRILRNPHDAEDAFQATFLVLVRKAASVVPREMVANWLYGVARTTALRANALSGKRRMRERQVREMPEPEFLPPNLWHDLQALLDQELGRLPDKYRITIVLCDLEGKSHKEAARQLGWPQGTVSGRLARGRKLLAERLARHGLSVSGGILAGVLAQNAASASAPVSLLSSTVKAASLLAAGQAPAAGLISTKAAALTEGVVITMLLKKLKTMGLVVVVLFMVASGGGLALTHATAEAQPAQPKTAKPKSPILPRAAAPNDRAESERVFVINTKLAEMDPDGDPRIITAPQVSVLEDQVARVHINTGTAFLERRRCREPSYPNWPSIRAQSQASRRGQGANRFTPYHLEG